MLEYIRPWADLYKVDLKSFDARHYRELGGRIAPILDSIARIHEMGFWLEVVTLVVPGFNDSGEELRAMAGIPGRHLAGHTLARDGISPGLQNDGAGQHAVRHTASRRRDWPRCGPALRLRRQPAGRDRPARRHPLPFVRRHVDLEARVPRTAKSLGRGRQVPRLRHDHPRRLGRFTPPSGRERRPGAYPLRLKGLHARHSKSPFSGTWYPEDGVELESLLAGRYAESERRIGRFFFPGALGYVVPHAGPAYSGTVAAAVYRALEEQRPERIVLLAFPHRGGLNGVVSPDAERISTPLGEVPLDGDFGGFPRVPEAHVCDHSFEIQLPFLQKAAPGARLTALYVGRMDAAARQAAASRLAEAWRPGVVFLASSDFTHYGRGFGYQPFPADSAVAARLRELDYACMDAAGSLDSGLFLETLGRARRPFAEQAPSHYCWTCCTR